MIWSILTTSHWILTLLLNCTGTCVLIPRTWMYWPPCFNEHSRLPLPIYGSIAWVWLPGAGGWVSRSTKRPEHCSLAATFTATFIAATPRPVYSHGSFTVDSPLLDMLTRSPAELVTKHAVATTGVYLPTAHGLLAAALRITATTGSASDAYYQELLGICVSILAARTTPLNAFSNCSSAITRANQSLSLLAPAVGHLPSSWNSGVILLAFSSIPLDVDALSPERKKRKHNPLGGSPTGAYTWQMS